MTMSFAGLHGLRTMSSMRWLLLLLCTIAVTVKAQKDDSSSQGCLEWTMPGDDAECSWEPNLKEVSISGGM